MKEILIKKIFDNFTLSEKEKKLIDEILLEDMCLPKISMVIDTLIEYYIKDDVLIAYLLFEFFKLNQDEASKISKKLTQEQLKIYEILKVLRGVCE